MVSNLFIFLAGLIATVLCVVFVVFSTREMQRLSRDSAAGHDERR